MAFPKIPDVVVIYDTNGNPVTFGTVTLDASALAALESITIGTALPAGAALLGKVGIDQTTPGTTNRVQSGGQMVRVAASEMTRPSDATPYTANDAVSNSTSAPAVLTFSNVGRVVGGQGAVVKAILTTDLKTDVKAYRLHLFDTAPTPVNDNAAYPMLYANNAIRQGFIDFPAMTTEDATNSTGARSIAVGYLLPFVCAAASRDLFGLLETLTAGTPASGQKYYVELTGDLH